MQTRLTLLFLLAFLLFQTVTHAQTKEYYSNKIGKYNNGKTIKLEFIENTYSQTILYFTYTGKRKAGKRTLMYFNNLRIVDNATGKSYYSKEAEDYKMEKKVYFFNTGQPIVITLSFPKLPPSLINFDLIEDGKISSSTNFTIKNIKLKPGKDASKELSVWDDKAPYPYSTTFFTYNNEIISVWIDGVYIGQLDKHFTKSNYKPECGELGTMTVAFSSGKSRKFKGSSLSGHKVWNFNFDPKERCSLRNLVIQK